MAYSQARSGVCYSGVVYTGWTPPSVKLYIAGIDRTSVCLADGDWTLTDRADGTPPTLIFSIKTITPTTGSEVLLTYATPDDYWFAGTLTNIEAHPVSNVSTRVIWHCTATGYQWLLDRYDLPWAQYFDELGINTIAGDLLSRWTNGGFKPGYLPSSLGTTRFDATDLIPISEQLTRLAALSDATLRIRPDKHVDICDVFPEGALATVTQADIVVDTLTYDEDLTQIRTSILRKVTGSTATADATVNALGNQEVPIDPTPEFDAAFIAKYVNFTVADAFVLSGLNPRMTMQAAGSAGVVVQGSTHLIHQGDQLDLLIRVNDSSDTTALATRLGGGLSGQATHFAPQVDTVSQAIAAAVSESSTNGSPRPTVVFTFKKVKRHLRAGRTLTMNITSPITITGDFLVQSLTTTIRGPVGGSKLEVFQTVQCSPIVYSLTTVLRQIQES